nr:MAG TPA: hypothetical protein [Caudoviricetes sp.]
MLRNGTAGTTRTSRKKIALRLPGSPSGIRSVPPGLRPSMRRSKRAGRSPA